MGPVFKPPLTRGIEGVGFISPPFIGRGMGRVGWFLTFASQLASKKQFDPFTEINLPLVVTFSH